MNRYSRTMTIRITTLIFLLACLFLVGLDLISFHTTLFDPNSITPDGAYSQYVYIRDLVEDQRVWHEAAENPIILTHVFRYAVYWPFIYLNKNEIGLEYALLVAICFPVINYYYDKTWHLFLLIVPLVAAYFISYRAVLAAMSIGYIVIYLFSSRHYIYLITGLLLSFLSSAVSLQVIVLLVSYGVFRDRRLLRSPHILIPFGLFCVIAGMVLIAKFEGFESGASGYASTATTQQGNVLFAILSRGTLYYSLLQGSARGYLYALIGIVILALIFKAFLTRDPLKKDHRFILLVLVPGFFGEGLGVSSIFMVIIWSLLKINLRKTRIKRNTGLNESPITPQGSGLMARTTR